MVRKVVGATMEEFAKEVHMHDGAKLGRLLKAATAVGTSAGKPVKNICLQAGSRFTQRVYREAADSDDDENSYT